MFGNDKTNQHSPPIVDEMSIGALLEQLARHSASRISFTYDNHVIDPGFHVTEVKSGQFAALDCGANPESWTELFVQLWDVDDAPEQMTVGKFTAIIRKVADHVALDMAGRLTFEVSDGVKPMQLHRAAKATVVDGEVCIDLLPRAASCKPRDRWLVQQNCCGDGPPPATRCCA